MSGTPEVLRPLSAGTRALTGADAAREHDIAVLRERFSQRMKQLETVATWMDRHGVPLAHLTVALADAF